MSRGDYGVGFAPGSQNLDHGFAVFVVSWIVVSIDFASVGAIPGSHEESGQVV